jgi:hypothetical protein
VRRALATALLALTVGLAGTGGAVLPASAQETPGGTITLSEQTPWLGAGDAYRLRVDVEGVRSPDELELVVSVHGAVGSRSEFARTVEGALLKAPLATVTAPLDYDAGGAVSVAFDPEGDGPDVAPLPDLDSGVYPVSVALRVRGGAVVDDFTTHLVRAPDDPDLPPLRVAWVQPFGAPPTLRPDGTSSLPAERRDLLATLAAAVAGAELPVTLVPVPETLEALAESEAGIVDDLAGALVDGSEVLAETFVALPPGAMADPAWVDDVLVQRATGSTVVDDVLGEEPEQATATTYGPVDPGALRRLTALGVERVVLTEDALAPPPAGVSTELTLLRPYDVDDGAGTTLRAVTADAGLAGHFGGDDPQLAAAHLLADLAVLFGDSPGLERGAVIHPPRRWDPTEAFLTTVLEGIAGNPMFDGTTVSDLVDEIPRLTDRRGDPVTRVLVEERSEPAGGGGLRVAQLRDQLAAMSAVLDPGHPDVAVLDRLLLTSQADQVDDALRGAYLDTVAGRLDQVRDGIRVLERSSYRLTAREGTIPLTIRNDNTFPVTVLLRLASDKLAFTSPHDGEVDGFLERELVLEPGTTAEHVQVVTRASGDFPLRIELRSPDGRLDLGRTRVTIRSTVASGVGMALSFGAGLFLLVWWGKHWRTVRRDRRLVAAPATS